MKCTRQRCQVAFKHPGDGGLQSFMGIGDHQLDAAQAAPSELAQELGPEGLGLGGADGHAEDLAPAIAVDADGDDDGDRDDAAVAAHLYVGGVEPDIRPIAFERPVEEGLHLAVDLAAQPGHLALGDAGHAHGLDQVVDRAGRDALDVGFLDHRGQCLLGHPPWFEEAREVAALAQLRDTQLDGAGAGLPIAVAIAVALGEPVGRCARRAPAPVRLSTSSSIRRCAAKPIISRRRSVSELFSSRARRFILSVGHRWVLGSR